jgi:hypothetical protein
MVGIQIESQYISFAKVSLQKKAFNYEISHIKKSEKSNIKGILYLIVISLNNNIEQSKFSLIYT